MNFSSFLKPAVFAAALVVAGAASAAVSARPAKDSQTYTVDAVSLTDQVSFSIASGFTADVIVDYTIKDLKVKDGSVSFIDPTSLTWALTYKPNSNHPATSTNSVSLLDLPALGASGKSTGTLSFDNLIAGNYSLTLTGAWAADAVTSTKLVTFTSPNVNLEGKAKISMITTPVPEPETYAMLLAGLGLVGSIIRRRKVS